MRRYLTFLVLGVFVLMVAVAPHASYAAVAGDPCNQSGTEHGVTKMDSDGVNIIACLKLSKTQTNNYVWKGMYGGSSCAAVPASTNTSTGYGQRIDAGEDKIVRSGLVSTNGLHIDTLQCQSGTWVVIASEATNPQGPNP